MKNAIYSIPDYEERLKVLGYLILKGFSRKEINRMDLLGPEYKLARDAMLFSVMESKEPLKTTTNKAP